MKDVPVRFMNHKLFSRVHMCGVCEKKEHAKRIRERKERELLKQAKDKEYERLVK